MLRTDAVIKLLKKNKQDMTLDEIWANVKEETMKSISVEKDEVAIKSDLYTSMLEDQNLVMVKEGYWNLRTNFSFDEIAEIIKLRVAEPDIELEESDDTRELNLGITDSIGEDE